MGALEVSMTPGRSEDGRTVVVIKRVSHETVLARTPSLYPVGPSFISLNNRVTRQYNEHSEFSNFIRSIHVFDTLLT